MTYLCKTFTGEPTARHQSCRRSSIRNCTDAVAAMYADQLVDQSVMNEAATAKQIAEQAALTDLSKDEQVQIQNWFAQVAADMGPTFRDTND